MQKRLISILFGVFVVSVGLHFVIPHVRDLINTGAFQNQKIEMLSAHEFKEIIKTEKTVLFDSRALEKYKNDHIPGAIFLDTNSLPSTLDNVETLRNDSKALLYSETDGEALVIARKIKNLGYSNVIILRGGIDSWTKAGYPIYIQQKQ